MTTKRHYVTLKTKGCNSYHKNGEIKKITERIINIGETADCDIRYDSND